MNKLNLNIATIMGLEGKWICYANDANWGWYVQDVDIQQNVELFTKGLYEIMRMEGKRGMFLRTFVLSMANTLEEVIGNKKGANERYCNFIAFVCDLANHKNLKGWNGVYHKDFLKFVDNLCWNYYLDVDWERYKKGQSVEFKYYESVA